MWKSDITASGDGGIVITNTNSLPPVALPRVASASCEAIERACSIVSPCGGELKVSKASCFRC